MVSLQKRPWGGIVEVNVQDAAADDDSDAAADDEGKKRRRKCGPEDEGECDDWMDTRVSNDDDDDDDDVGWCVVYCMCVDL